MDLKIQSILKRHQRDQILGMTLLPFQPLPLHSSRLAETYIDDIISEPPYKDLDRPYVENISLFTPSLRSKGFLASASIRKSI